MFTTTRPIPDPYEPLLLKPALDGLAAGRAPSETGPDEFPIFDSDPLASQHRVISRYMTDGREKYDKKMKVREVEGAAMMLDAEPVARFAFILAALTRELWYWKHAVKQSTVPGMHFKAWEIRSDPLVKPLHPLVSNLLRKLEGTMPYDAVAKLVDAATIYNVGSRIREYVSLEKIVPMVVAVCSAEGVDDAMLEPLEKLRALVKPNEYEYGGRLREKQEFTEQIESIFKPKPTEARPARVDPGEPWADAVLAACQGAAGDKWDALVEYASAADGSQPTQKWLKGAKTLVDAIGINAFEKTMVSWLELASKPRSAPMTQDQLRHTAFGIQDPSLDLYAPKNEEVLKGIAWIAGGADRAAFASGLGMLAERCYKKVPMIGPRSAKVGNACLVALTSMSSRKATAQLSRLKSIVKQPTGRKMIEKALSRMADKQGVTVDDLEESTVPKFDLVDGKTERKIGPATLRIAITPAADVEQTWIDADGKPKKSVPAAVKNEHADALKALKRELSDLDKTLSAQRLRIERLFLRRTPWAFDAWREAYHDHPLVQLLSRRLIWTFSEDDDKATAAAWDGKQFVDSSDKPLKVDPAATKVTLWHPSTASTGEVLAWRRWLEKHQITQPFKQAHREIYLLTDAERNTGNYSNRFAQHIIRQHQFQAICQQRGWKYQLMGGFDFHNYPSIEIPAWDTKVEFWIEAAAETGVSASGIAMHMSTDQLRFLNPKTGEPRALEEVPALLMSEVMRDVDLFVAVTSVGNDPTWQDGGPDGQHRDYWQRTSFGELTETAITRQAVLESMMPRLTKLAGKWSLEPRFLVIKGTLRTYKIHLGSGNILMEPNDQYLCIVPDSAKRTAVDVFLPFEGDATLSVILSKAFLLAEDSKIKDESIMRQIKR
jgi:hypothetical protein